MSQTERKQLDELLRIAKESDSPLSEWEADFVTSLDERRDRVLTGKQADVFDRLVAKHLCGD